MGFIALLWRQSTEGISISGLAGPGMLLVTAGGVLFFWVWKGGTVILFGGERAKEKELWHLLLIFLDRQIPGAHGKHKTNNNTRHREALKSFPHGANSPRVRVTTRWMRIRALAHVPLTCTFICNCKQINKHINNHYLDKLQQFYHLNFMEYSNLWARFPNITMNLPFFFDSLSTICCSCPSVLWLQLVAASHFGLPVGCRRWS